MTTAVAPREQVPTPVDLETFYAKFRLMRRNPSLFRQELLRLESTLPPAYLEALELLFDSKNELCPRGIVAAVPTLLASQVAFAVVCSVDDREMTRYFPLPERQLLKKLLKEWQETPSGSRRFTFVQMWEIAYDAISSYHPRLAASIEQLIRSDLHLDAEDQELTFFLLGAFFLLATRSRAQTGHAIARMAGYATIRGRQLAKEGGRRTDSSCTHS